MPLIAENTAAYYANKKLKDFNNRVNNKLNELNKKITTSEGSKITITNNETKVIMKVIRSLENRGILLKETTKKVSRQEGRLLNFLKP